MIRLLRDCFDKSGNRYKAISFNGDKYQCQSYSTGKMHYFAVNEISASPPRPEQKITFTQIVKKKEEEKTQESEIVTPPVVTTLEPTYEIETREPEIIVPPVATVLEPSYEEHAYETPDYDYGIDESEKVIVPKDNIEETAKDFYADF